MTTLDEMNIKNKKFAPRPAKRWGFTLIELMVASTIATVVLIVSFSLIGNIYFARKQIRIAQNFYSESRFLLEKIVTISRENTIDYDRYFEEVGPSNAPVECLQFSDDQGGPDSSTLLRGNNDVNIQTNKDNRKNLGYPNIFYWKISEDIYRNLGGKDKNGNTDKCAAAFHGTLPALYLINRERNIRTAIRLEDNRIQTRIDLGVDISLDGKADSWLPHYKWESNKCNTYDSPSLDSGKKPALIQDEELCNQAHDWQNVSAKNLIISSFNFTPYPDRDPYLNFRNDDAQIHPNIFLFMKVDLANYANYGFENQPTITMQTSVSSRVFGDTRK